MKRYLVEGEGANPAFREAPVRKHSPSNEEYRFDTDVPNRLTEQKRLSIYNWNPGPRRGKQEAIEKHTAGKWHIITLQDAVEYLDRDYLTNRFYVTHFGGCAVLFNKDTFHPDIKVSSVYRHDTGDGQQQDVKGETTGCHVKGVVSAAGTQRQIVLHHDVIAHQQPSCQEARYREEVTTYNPRCDARGACGLGCWGRCRLAPMREAIENPQVLLKTSSLVRTCRCHLAPYHRAGQERCRAKGQMCAGFSSHRTPMKSGRYAYTVLFLSPTTP